MFLNQVNTRMFKHSSNRLGIQLSDLAVAPFLQRYHESLAVFWFRAATASMLILPGQLNFKFLSIIFSKFSSTASLSVNVLFDASSKNSDKTLYAFSERELEFHGER